MSQPSSGLRFDIYERVQLPENTAGVKEINAIELAPDIRVVARGEQAVLKGHLTLSGTYTSEDETRGEEERLTHLIPVEITLPLSRVANVDDIRVEIENFDVDVLSSRSLNVTGVLSLGGIEMSAPAEAAWRNEEEVVFTHRVEAAEAAANAPQPQPEAEPPPRAEAQEQPEAAVAAVASEALTTNAAANEAVYGAAAAEAEPANEPASNKPASNEAAANVSAANAAAEDAADAALDAMESMDSAEAPVEAEVPAKPEIKIAFSGKPAADDAAAPLGVNAIMSSMTSASPAAVPPPPAEKRSSEAPEQEQKDRVEWKRLFLQAEEGPSFRKMRLCIAQKEDTIETIADRYQKNVRELMLHNRLNDQYLHEGQVVYIP